MLVLLHLTPGNVTSVITAWKNVDDVLSGRWTHGKGLELAKKYIVCAEIAQLGER